MRAQSGGNRWAVIIGVDHYHESLGDLRFCGNDARLLREALMSEACGFDGNNILLLTEDELPDRLEVGFRPSNPLGSTGTITWRKAQALVAEELGRRGLVLGTAREGIPSVELTHCQGVWNKVTSIAACAYGASGEVLLEGGVDV